MDHFLAELNNKTLDVRVSTVIVTTSFLCVLGLFILFIFNQGSHAKPEPAEISKHSSNSKKEKTSSGLTFRVTEIPAEIEESDLRRFLEGLAPGNNEAKVTILALSLGPSSSSLDFERYQVATVTFDQTPVVLRPCLSQPKTVSLLLPCASRSSEICFDACFLGLTPLNNTQNPSVEYVVVSVVS